uniref:Uncharacterized protein n=1 Tax=Bubo bubo TaxID=30461 RepID=A0A8C0I745_BUBBB
MDRNLKNVLVISFGFLLLFTAYGGLQSLQSSLHSEGGLGVASLSVLYAALILSSMFLPPILIKKLGCKWTIAGSMCCYVAFSLGNFYASWYNLNILTLSIVGGCLLASGSGSRGPQEEAISCLALSEVDEQLLLSSDRGRTSAEESCCDPSSEGQVQFNSQLQEDKAHEHRPSQPSLGLAPGQSWESLHILNFIRLALSWFHVRDVLNHTHKG